MLHYTHHAALYTYIIYLVACFLSESWCCVDSLGRQGKLKNNHSASLAIFAARKAIYLKKQLIELNIVREEMTLLGTVLPEGSDQDIPMIILISSSLLSIAVDFISFGCLSLIYRGKRVNPASATLQHYMLQLQQTLLYYAALCWASQTLLLSPGINDVSGFHWLPFY